MKKTNTFKRFAAITSASILAACMVAPMAMTSNAASIEITGISTEVPHTFEVYQVFTGDLLDGKLSNLKWGSGVTSYAGNGVTAGVDVDDTIVSAITAMTDANGLINDTTGLELGTKCGEMTSTNGTASISTLTGGTALPDGYYVVKDVTGLDGENDANSSWIIQVADSASIKIKNEIPRVDKQILDEADDAEEGHTNGWGESADHAINEQFKFKLTATIPVNVDLKYYETYKLVFNDTMSAGVTFDEIESVKITSTTTDLPLASTQYSETATATANKAGLTWTLTIDDVKALVNADDKDVFGTEAITIEVIYKAHLNENAKVSKENVTDGTKDTVNNNMVYLQYSNNPDSTGSGTTGLGETEKDYVWAFTYEVDNIKYADDDIAGKELNGAGFQLLNGSTPIKFIDNGDGTYTVANQDAALTEEGVTPKIVNTMFSSNGGKFNIIGLDAGTYTLTETVTPGGYNTCKDKTIIIDATHKEDTASTVDMTLSDDSTMSNSVINKSGSSLPETGGIGTTLFYLGGGAMVAVAGVYLISKKRMKNAE